ncbi:hypothetical protein ANANG_G00215070, partial [Anguilla anguilla]
GRHGSAQESPSSFPSFPPFFLPSPCPNPRIFPQQPFFFCFPSPRLSGGGIRPTESSSDARTGVLAVRTTGSPAPRVPAHGGGAGGPCCRPAHLRSRSRRSVLYSVSLGFLKE